MLILSDYAGGDSAASGGAGHAVLDSYRALRAASVDVQVVAGFGGPPPIAAERFVGLGGADLRSAGAKGAAAAIWNPASRSALSDVLAGHDPARTLVILHQWTRYLSPSAIALLGRFPTMIYMHDYFWPCPNGAYYDFREQRPCDRRPLGARCIGADCDRGGRALKIGRLARHAALRSAQAGSAQKRLFLHISEQAHRTAAPLLPRERHAILHNPLAVDRAVPPPAEPTYDIGYFGRLEPEKGLGLLYEAIATAGHRALVVGQGAMVPSHSRIEYRPWQARERMAEAMRACRVVVLPSLWPETWGLVVPEAMAAGVPVLVSRRAGAAELVRRFGGGATFDPGVAGDFATTLDRLLYAPAPRETGVTDRVAFARFLSADRHAERIVALAGDTFGIDLRPDSVVSAPRPTARDIRPVARPPLAR